MVGSPSVNGYACYLPIRNYTCKDMPRSVDSVTSFRIRTDAPLIQLTGMFPDGVGTVQTLIVDGELVPAVPLSANRGQGGGYVGGSIQIDFGSRAMRDIWWQSSVLAAYFAVSAHDTVLPWNDVAEPSLTVVGDSYLQCCSPAFGNGGAIALSVGARLGLRNVATDAVGGTGYWNSGGDLGNLLDRLPGHGADGSSIYLVLAGLNDYNDVRADGTIDVPATATYADAVLAYYEGLRQANPAAVIVVTAPFCPIPSLSDSTYLSVTLPQGVALGSYQYRAYVHRSALEQITGPWVYIDVLMGDGWVNSSGRSGDISQLQWLTGGTPGAGTTATYKPGNTQGGGGGGFGGIAEIPVIDGGLYSQAPDLLAIGGSGTGLLATASIDTSGRLNRVFIHSQGQGYSPDSGLPQMRIDNRFELTPATLGTPRLTVGINPDGLYPLPAFAPAGATDLNNIYVNLGEDTVHPSPVGVEYLASRLASNIYDAILAL